MKSFGRTDKGLKRIRNEDAIFYTDNAIGNLPNLYIVADGMGGHKGGEFASQFAVINFVKYVENHNSNNPVIIFDEGIKLINQFIHDKSTNNEDLYKMGTTFVVATVIQGILYIANVGDSRLYILNDKMKKITKDHSLVEEMLHNGLISPDEANKHPDKHIITRAIGAEKEIQVDLFEVELEINDSILMCSDGLTNMIEEKNIYDLIKSKEEQTEVVNELINKANINGGSDNISVIIINF